ncbi:MAG: hypothetical protein A3B37_00240 [Candidatus Sungbacteria bacterium RIFCSPLOWO2_01_FULL_59_16]|uniref:DNA polymerase IV n=1 Tax=Candidatus Sungbacteria bacterium RIFCSPLOWO2_01_FULL_59_16 TaxID=1802280 RepID=A0A1G2LA52_9BACT|nr:MAG: hypothetical protein A3B37_00240 [Candidatus Sungbacteria bacterium RIFCSPLOWO2_01_FULL_59_16]
MRIIAHIDMDAFFAAVEERYNPRLSGLPIVVGADPKEGRGRGVVSTANYAARRYGIRSALPISQAWRLSEAARQKGEPAAVFLRGNHELYREVSERIMVILREGADAFEAASIDEAYLDVSSLGSFEKAGGHARLLKSAILNLESLTSSVGIGPNKLVAKIASDFTKPDGLTIVRPEGVQPFLDPMPVRKIPGVGPKTEAFLYRRGIRTIRELRAVARAELVHAFGAWGEDLYEKAHGISEDPVSNEWEPKSVGEQETFETDTLQAAFVLERLRALADAVFGRFERDGFASFRTVVVTVRFADFATTTRSHTAAEPLATREALHGEALRLILPFLDSRENPKRKKIRLIGVRVEKLLRGNVAS